VGKENAAGALYNLAANADNQVAIAKVEGALAALVALLRDGSAVGKETAAGALQNLALNADNKVAIAEEHGALAALVALFCARGAR
jgi:vacuolar protein 8